jgi:hypothetical protein
MVDTRVNPSKFVMTKTGKFCATKEITIALDYNSENK